MRKKTFWLFVIIGLFVFQPMVVHAGGYGKVKDCKIESLTEKTKILWENQEELKISDKQLDAIKDIKHAAIKQLLRLQADQGIVMVDLKFLMYDDVIDVAKANPLIDAKYAAKAEVKKAYIKAISDIQQELTAEQREQWRELSKSCEKGCDKQKDCGGACNRKDCPRKKGIKICPITGKPLSK